MCRSAFWSTAVGKLIDRLWMRRNTVALAALAGAFCRVRLAFSFERCFSIPWFVSPGIPTDLASLALWSDMLLEAVGCRRARVGHRYWHRLRQGCRSKMQMFCRFCSNLNQLSSIVIFRIFSLFLIFSRLYFYILLPLSTRCPWWWPQVGCFG